MKENDGPLTNPATILEFSNRSWMCLRDDIVAAYVDGVLDETSRGRTESHLADCEVCRNLVGDVVAMQRVETLPLPLGLAQRAAIVTVPSQKRRILTPAVLSAGLACAMVVTFFMVNRQEIQLLPSKVPIAPEIAKSEPPPTQGDTSSDAVRTLTPSARLPKILFPVDNMVLKREEITFKWKTLPPVERYEVHLVTSEGDPVWEGESKTTALAIPPNVRLKDGPYFVWIVAVLNDGHVEKSVPVRFLLKTTL